MKKYELIVFDLDGTLLDTSLGIFNSVRYAELEMGFQPIPEEDLKKFVGPPPKTMYQEMYDLDEEMAFEAAKKHREYGRSRGVFEACVYPEMKECLDSLKEQGYHLAVATLKQQKIAEMVLDNFGLSSYFDSIIGMDVDESYTKCQTIQLAIERTRTTKHVLMIGDSKYDYEGAVAAGVDFLGVLYGFGFERFGEYPFATISQPKDIEKYILSMKGK